MARCNTCLGCLHCRIDQSFATAHCVKEEFRRCKAGVEGIAHKPLCRWRLVVAAKVWQGSVLKAIGDSLAIDNLLPNTRHHLGNVEIASFGSTLGHDFRCIGTCTDQTHRPHGWCINRPAGASGKNAHNNECMCVVFVGGVYGLCAHLCRIATLHKFMCVRVCILVGDIHLMS